MELQGIINVSAGAILTALGWFGRQLWDAVTQLRQDIRIIERDLPVLYVRRDDFVERMNRIEDMLGKIFDKLDGKVDK